MTESLDHKPNPAGCRLFVDLTLEDQQCIKEVMDDCLDTLTTANNTWAVYVVTQTSIKEFTRLPGLVTVLGIWDLFNVVKVERRLHAFLLPSVIPITDQPGSSMDSSAGDNPSIDLSSHCKHKKSLRQNQSGFNELQLLPPLESLQTHEKEQWRIL